MRWTSLGAPLLVMSSEYESMRHIGSQVAKKLKKRRNFQQGIYDLHPEPICHRYNETDALARRNLSLCRCIFAFAGIINFHSVGCRSPPASLNFYILKIQTGGKEKMAKKANLMF